MIKRTLMVMGLGMALLGGVATTTFASSHVSAHPTTARAGVMAGETDAQAADTDVSAPCATDATGNQTGDCQNSQNASGPEDNGAAGSEGDIGGPDTGNVQTGGQSGQ